MRWNGPGNGNPQDLEEGILKQNYQEVRSQVDASFTKLTMYSNTGLCVQQPVFFLITFVM